MFFQRSSNVCPKFMNLKLTPITILKSNIYGDSIYRPERKSQRKSQFQKQRENVKEVPVFTSLFITNNMVKNDWFRNFRKMEFSHEGIVNWYKNHKTEVEKVTQEFIEERHNILGSNLSAAFFIIKLGGRVKFKCNDNWIKKEKGITLDLPKTFDPKYVLEGIDCSGINIHYEGLENFNNLTKVKWVSFKGNNLLTDWYTDKITAEFPNLEYLDVSECEQFTERGLESLYKLNKLKKVIVTNWHNSEDMEYTCLFLEDCMPGLKCDILPPPNKTAKDEKGNKDERFY